MSTNIRSRCATVVVFAIFSLTVASASAQEMYPKWISFFEGDWTWSSDNGMAGEIKFERPDKEIEALSIRFKMFKPDPGTSLAMMGWDNASKLIVETGYDSAGGSGHTKYEIVSDKQLKGSWTSTGPDGSTRKTTFDLNRVSDDVYVLENTQTSGEDGGESWKTITVRRKK